MSSHWKYDGHEDKSTQIRSIYCSKVIHNVPPVFIWMVVLEGGIERSLGSFHESDFLHEEDKKALNYALKNFEALNQKELDKYYNLISGQR